MSSSDVPPTIVQPMLITADQVAAMLQVSTRTVWRLRSRGDLPAPVHVGGVRWRRADVEAWINAGCLGK